MNRALYTERQAKIIKLFYISSLLSSFNNFSFNCDFILFSTSQPSLRPASSPNRGASGVSSKPDPTAKASPIRRGGNAKH
jgi:hypothetical protein